MQKVTINLIPLLQDVTLEIDLLRMHQVVIHLLSNALKFSKTSDVIEVKIGVTSIGEFNEVLLTIEVKD